MEFVAPQGQGEALREAFAKTAAPYAWSLVRLWKQTYPGGIYFTSMPLLKVAYGSWIRIISKPESKIKLREGESGCSTVPKIDLKAG